MSTGDALKMGPDAGPTLSGGGLLLADNQSLNERVRLGGLRRRGQDRLLVLFKDFYK